MDEERNEILRLCDKKMHEIERLNMKIQIFTEAIAHFRSRVANCETKKKEIHNEIIDLKDRVSAWQRARNNKTEGE